MIQSEENGSPVSLGDQPERSNASWVEGIRGVIRDLKRRSDPAEVLRGEAAAYALNSLPLSERAQLLQESRAAQTDPLYQGRQAVSIPVQAGKAFAAGIAASALMSALLPKTKLYNALEEGGRARNDALLAKYVATLAPTPDAAARVNPLLAGNLRAQGMDASNVGKTFAGNRRSGFFADRPGNVSALKSDVERLAKGPGVAAFGDSDTGRRALLRALQETEKAVGGSPAADPLRQRLKYRLLGEGAPAASVSDPLKFLSTPGAFVDLLDAKGPPLLRDINPSMMNSPAINSFPSLAKKPGLRMLSVLPPSVLVGLLAGGVAGGTMIPKYLKQRRRAQETHSDPDALYDELSAFDSAQAEAAVESRLKGMLRSNAITDEKRMLAMMESSLNDLPLKKYPFLGTEATAQDLLM